MLADEVMPPRIDRRLATCVLVALGLHGLVLAWVQHRPDDGAAQTLARAGQAVQARVLSVAPPVAPQAVVQQPSPQTSSDASSGEPNALAQAGHSAVDLNGYVPRRWLTVGPEPTAPILLPFPSAFKDRARYIVVLNLYIETDGRVGRVEFEGVPLPDLLERTARNAFEHARFTPGEVQGRIVKSLIRVEVNFDALGAD
jgi:hypothetical protein